MSAFWGDENADYGYPHFHNERVISQDDLQAEVKAKEQYLMNVKSSDEIVI